MLFNVAIIVLLVILVSKVFTLFFDFINLLRGYSPNLPSNARFRKQVSQIYQFKKGQKIADFGCGSGKLIDIIKNLQVSITGVELNPLLARFCKLKYMFNKNIKIVRGDLLDQNLKEFDVIMIYAVPEVMKKLEAKIIAEKPINLTIISNRFKFEKIPSIKELPNTYLYKINSTHLG